VDHPGQLLIKPVVQAELGRYTIATGHTGLEGFDRMPGPRLGVSWLVWAWGITVALTLLQVGGMYGGVAQVLHLLAPAIPLNLWVGICLLLTIAILLGGGYERIEKLAIVKVGFFTMLTVCAAAVLLRSDAVTASNLAGGLSLQLPAAGLATAIAVFGMTGVGGTELVQYAVLVRRERLRAVRRTAGWIGGLDFARRGWIRVMHLDIACSLVIYTLATVAFYLLGAGVLHRMGAVPAERDTVRVLSQIYTQTLGDWALWLFYAGAVVTLCGTIFAATAAHSRLFADAMRIGGMFQRDDTRRRRQWRNGFLVALSVIPPCSTGSSNRRCRWCWPADWRSRRSCR
jgi:hypothetical protein